MSKTTFTKRKVERMEARVMALTNAAAMIDGHGEEGGQFQEDYPVDLDIYFKECKKVAKKLNKEADKIQSAITTLLQSITHA